MSTGISGPGGPRGPGGAGSAGDVASSATATAGVERAGAALTAEVERLRATGSTGATGELGQLAADLDAGRITGDEALAQMIAGMGLDIGELEGGELRELLADLAASDPYLAGLAARLGATSGGGDG